MAMGDSFANQFLEATQDELREMEPHRRQQTINETCRQLGYSECAIENLARLGRTRDQPGNQASSTCRRAKRLSQTTRARSVRSDSTPRGNRSREHRPRPFAGRKRQATSGSNRNGPTGFSRTKVQRPAKRRVFSHHRMRPNEGFRPAGANADSQKRPSRPNQARTGQEKQALERIRKATRGTRHQYRR